MFAFFNFIYIYAEDKGHEGRLSARAKPQIKSVYARARVVLHRMKVNAREGESALGESNWGFGHLVREIRRAISLSLSLSFFLSLYLSVSPHGRVLGSYRAF